MFCKGQGFRRGRTEGSGHVYLSTTFIRHYENGSSTNKEKQTFFTARQPLVSQGLLIVKVSSRSHSETPHPVGFLRMSDQPDAENYT